MVSRGGYDWKWYDYHIVFWVIIMVAIMVIPFAAWIFGWEF